MKILFVHPACRLSIWDVARGYRAALGKIIGDANIKDYFLDRRLTYHIKAAEAVAPPAVSKDQALMSRFASETVLNEALYFGADLVLIASGLNLHAIALWELEKVGIPAAVILTECPYDDAPQREWCSTYPAMQIFTHEKISSEREGWDYLPSAHDPNVHHPVDGIDKTIDVLMVGTGWRERQLFLEEVDWTGIRLKILGPKAAWPAMTEESNIWPFFEDVAVDNRKIAPLYAASKICLNFHRRHQTAWSPNPRAYEIAACGAFQLCDPRPGVKELFGETVPIFGSPQELGQQVRHYLANDDERNRLAALSRERVKNETFDERAKVMLESVQSRFNLPWLQEA